MTDLVRMLEQVKIQVHAGFEIGSMKFDSQLMCVILFYTPTYVLKLFYPYFLTAIYSRKICLNFISV